MIYHLQLLRVWTPSSGLYNALFLLPHRPQSDRPIGHFQLHLRPFRAPNRSSGAGLHAVACWLNGGITRNDSPKIRLRGQLAGGLVGEGRVDGAAAGGNGAGAGWSEAGYVDSAAAQGDGQLALEVVNG